MKVAVSQTSAALSWMLLSMPEALWILPECLTIVLSFEKSCCHGKSWLAAWFDLESLWKQTSGHACERVSRISWLRRPILHVGNIIPAWDPGLNIKEKAIDCLQLFLLPECVCNARSCLKFMYPWLSYHAELDSGTVSQINLSFHKLL